MSTPAEIAKMLLNGEVGIAHRELTHQPNGGWGCMLDGGLLVLDVVDELARMYSFDVGDIVVPGHQRAIATVRRVLKGKP